MFAKKHNFILAYILFVSLFSSAAFSLPVLDYAAPTYPDNTIISANYTGINITITEPGLDTFKFNWNGANYSIYDSSLVLMMNLNNNPAIGETPTKFVDVSRYGNNGTCSGSTCPISAAGKFGNAMMFDGNNDYIQINSVVTELNSVFTVTAWIKTSTSMSPGSIVTFHDSGGDNKWRLEVNGNNAGIAPNDATGSRIVTDNRWHHITGVTNGVISYIYVDGVLDLGSVATNTNLVDTDLASIGQEWDPGPTATDFFDGTIDEVRIYNRALSAAEITMHYQSEFQKYNGAQWRFYSNVSKLPNGKYTYYNWANNTAGSSNATKMHTLLIGCQALTTPNTYYELAQNISSPGECFRIRANNITLDGNGYTVNYARSINGYGVDNSERYDNITIKSVNFVQENPSVIQAHAILFNGSVYGNITNNTITVSGGCDIGCGSGDGIGLFDSSNFNSISNNKINVKGNNSDGIWIQSSNSNLFSNNDVVASGSSPVTSLAGVNIYNSSGNNITGGSVISQNTYDYLLNNANATNTFRNTNFTVLRKIYFKDVNSWFNYNNETNGNIWLKTSVSAAASSISRTLVTWSQSTIKWNDTSSAVGTTARYNLTGLLPNRQYTVKNTTNSGSTTQTFMTNGNGDLPGFMIKLGGNTQVLVSSDSVTLSIAFVPPTDNNGASISRNWTYINTTISNDISPGNLTAFIDWNNSLVGWWRFNNEAGESSTLFKDWSSWGNDGMCSAPTCPVSAAGKFGNALQFDGFNDYVDVGNTGASLNLTSNFSIEAWIYEVGARNNWHTIVSKGESPLDKYNNYFLQMNRSGNIFLIIGDGTNSKEFITSSALSTNRWYHITALFYSASDMRIYVDGVLWPGSYSGSATYTATNNKKVIIGATDTKLNDTFNGTIDELKIWNRVLSPEEIKASFNAGVYRLYHNFTSLADGTYAYTAYAQDLAGNVNQTETRTITIGSIPLPPFISFVPPTPDDGNTTANNWIYVNVSVSGGSSPNNLTSFIDWNRSLVGWWRFNNEAGENTTLFRDWSSYQNNGTCSGSACPASVAGKFGNALQFDGVDSYIQISSSPSLKLSYGTYNMWVKVGPWVQTWSGSNLTVPLFHGSWANGEAFFITNDPTPTFSARAYIGQTIYDSSSTTIQIDRNSYHMLTMSLNGTNFRVYMDGVLRYDNAGANGGLNLSVLSNPLIIGAATNGYWRDFSGTIDEVSIFNRALSPEEIRAAYNVGAYRLYHRFTNLPDGTYTYTAYAQDMAGNVGQTETRTVHISRIIPLVPEILTQFRRQGSAWTVTRYAIYDGHIARVTLTYW